MKAKITIKFLKIANKEINLSLLKKEGGLEASTKGLVINVCESLEKFLRGKRIEVFDVVAKLDKENGITGIITFDIRKIIGFEMTSDISQFVVNAFKKDLLIFMANIKMYLLAKGIKTETIIEVAK
jgi:hypothetical protein